jgi:hypothetical protein
MFTSDEANELAAIVRRVVREELERALGAQRPPEAQRARVVDDRVELDPLFERYWTAVGAKWDAMDAVRERAKELGAKPQYRQDRRYREAAAAAKAAQAEWSASLPERAPDPEAVRLGNRYSAAAGKRRDALEEVKERARARGVKPDPWKDPGYLAALEESKATGRAWRGYTAAQAAERERHSRDELGCE